MKSQLVKFIKSLYPNYESIPLHEPVFNNKEKEYLAKAIDSTYVSSFGPFVEEFEENFSKYVSSKFTIATVNGTSALHLALVATGVSNNDLVITQSLTFVATANAISYCGAAPIFLDVDEENLGLSPVALKHYLEKNCYKKSQTCFHNKSHKRVKACIPMHSFGHPTKIDELQTICREWNLTLIEDAAESLGSYFHKKHTGTFGEMGVFSFNGNKIITSGGGGCVVTDDPVLAKRLKHLSTTAKTYHPFNISHDEIGFNYRLPNINAALLLAQLEKLEQFLVFKRQLAQSYAKFFENNEIKFINEPESCQSNYWLNCILLENVDLRNDLLKYTQNHKIQTRPCWTPLINLPMYKNCINDGCQNARDIASRLINLPSSVILN